MRTGTGCDVSPGRGSHGFGPLDVVSGTKKLQVALVWKYFCHTIFATRGEDYYISDLISALFSGATGAASGPHSRGQVVEVLDRGPPNPFCQMERSNIAASQP